MGVHPAVEPAIAAHLASGDHAAAATEALRGLGPQILGFLAANLRDDDDAYDVFGQFSEELWKSISTFRGDSSFKTWAYKLVLHSLGRYRRDSYRKRGIPMADSAASALVAEVRSVTPRYQQTAIKDRFTQLREQLEPDEQTLLFLRVDQQLPWADVASVMAAQGEPVDAAALRKRFERTKERLKQLVADAGLLEE